MIDRSWILTIPLGIWRMPDGSSVEVRAEPELRYGAKIVHYLNGVRVAETPIDDAHRKDLTTTYRLTPKGRRMAERLRSQGN